MFTGKLMAEDVPPAGVEFTAVTARLPIADTSADVKAALSWVALMNVLGREVPLTSIIVVGTNPVR